MLKLSDIKQIINKLSLKDSTLLECDLSEEVSCIIYRTDVFKCGDTDIISRHIDIEFSFGDYVELHVEDSLFQYICELCNLQQLEKGNSDIILYKKGAVKNGI